jgi:hypothetical protein
MQKFLTLLASVSIMAMLVFLSSCKDDEAEPQKSTISFSTSAKTVGEGDAGVKASLVLDKPAPTDIIVEYELKGDAKRKIGAATDGDYEISGSVGEIEIAQGESAGSIDLNILTDNVLEQDEKIILTIVDVSSAQVEIGTDDEMTITIQGGGSVTASFATATPLTVNEADEGAHELEVTLNEAVGFDVNVLYDLSPWLDASGNYIEFSAIDTISGAAEELDSFYWDYYIDGTSGTLTIPAGQTSGKIKFVVYTDFVAEFEEKFTVTLKASTGVTVGTNPAKTVNIVQEDGLLVELAWGPAPDETYDDVDMDLMVWAEDEEGELQHTGIGSYAESTESPESIFLPSAAMNDGEFGLSYNYYSGTADPMHFEVFFWEFADGDPVGDPTSYTGTYTEANLNPWFETEVLPLLSQTFTKAGGTFSNFSDITIHDEGSRQKSYEVPQGLKRRSAPAKGMHYRKQ